MASYCNTGLAPEVVVVTLPDGTTYDYFPEINCPDVFIHGKPKLPDPRIAEMWCAYGRWLARKRGEQLTIPGLERSAEH